MFLQRIFKLKKGKYGCIYQQLNVLTITESNTFLGLVNIPNLQLQFFIEFFFIKLLVNSIILNINLIYS